MPNDVIHGYNSKKRIDNLKGWYCSFFVAGLSMKKHINWCIPILQLENLSTWC